MNTNVALIIIHNHKYVDNIEILELVYHERFSNIFHLMPFYAGDKPNVISVYENSRYFEGYIAQGSARYLRGGISHYFFIADDLILNPVINEKNYTEHFKLNEDASFLSSYKNLHEQVVWWSKVAEAYEYRSNKLGVEAEKELPSYNEALECFKRFNLVLKPLSFNQIYKKESISLQTFVSKAQAMTLLGYLLRKLESILRKETYNLTYPLVGSYSDISIVSSNIIRPFCHYCGVFAATDLFAELALPTALVLSATNIVTEKDLRLHGKSMWTSEDYKEILKYDNKLKLLLSDFPENYIYLHPIKLSKWDTRI